MSQQFRETQAKWKHFYKKYEKKKAEKRRREQRKAFIKRILSHAGIYFYLLLCVYLLISNLGVNVFPRIFVAL